MTRFGGAGFGSGGGGDLLYLKVCSHPATAGFFDAYLFNFGGEMSYKNERSILEASTDAEVVWRR